MARLTIISASYPMIEAIAPCRVYAVPASRVGRFPEGEFDPDQSAKSSVPSKQLKVARNQSGGEPVMSSIALTRREQEVADLVCIGFSNKQIAQYLAISEKTVTLLLKKIYKKLDVRSRPALAALVMAEGTLPMAA
jgi:DNA-binding NarL/FixJ family response regulator